ncbi:MAG: sulfatase [Planctomycetaceae bacterium]|nr:sulfatase [Planctomycetaceae bacterium]
MEAQAERPNILFIYTDDHSYRTISCYPEAFDWVRTPNIDALARDGMRFTHAYVGTWCMPSRATLLTGHHQFGVESMRMEGKYPGSAYDPEQCPFWPSVFRKNGYLTAHIGKWHTGTDTGFGRDWDYQIVWNRPKHPDTSQHYYYDQPITYQGGETKMLQEYSTDKYTDWAVDFLQGKGRDEAKPWYLWLCYGAVHSPFTPADRHLKDYEGIDVPTPADIFPPRPGKPDWAQRIEFWKRGPNGEPVYGGRNGKTLHAWVRQYHQAVKALDEGIGRVLKTLDETGQRDNTLIVFTSDQGFAWGQHGFRHKMAAYDANIRSPMVVSYPKVIPKGSVCETPVGGVDIVPTIFSFAGMKHPWQFHGHDLTPLLRDPKADWPHPILLTNTNRAYGSATATPPANGIDHNSGIPWYVMLRKERWKYVRALIPDAMEELYDLDEDPEELTNLAMQTASQGTLRELRQAAIEELQRNSAPFANNLPAVKEVTP